MCIVFVLQACACFHGAQGHACCGALVKHYPAE